ncbi:MAG: domain S-box [Brevibacillus sp.]|nr:domain S-box [Brevibacillus sp.]
MNMSSCMTREFVALHADCTLGEVLTQFLEHRQDVGCVLYADGTLEGIITKYQLYRMILKHCPLDTPITPYIYRDVTTVPFHYPVTEARKILLSAKVAHAVIVDDNDKVVGVSTKGDLIQSFLQRERRLINQMTSLIENLEDGVIGIDHMHNIHTFNSAAAAMFQLDHHTALEENVRSLLPQIGDEMILALENEAPIEPQKLQLPAAVTMASYTPIIVRDKAIGAIAVLKDLTAYEKVASELETTKRLERMLESALEMAYDGIAIIDEQGCFQMVNDALLELYDISREDLLGTPASKSLPELNLEDTLRTGKEGVGDIQVIRGKKCVITRMPIIVQNKHAGAIAKVIFRQLPHMKDLFNRMENLEHELTYYRGEYLRSHSHGTALDHLITRNPSLDAIKNQAYLAAQGFSTVLITGESGTGKELFAQAIHEISGRPGRFVKVNCAAIPEELLESEFFGYADGAFTGARKGGKPGKFELADGGTLFLDEIGDMPLALQAKLLRVLQERSFDRIGDTVSRTVDVRIVSATNKRLEDLISEGKFREDLYYRIHVIHLSIPPLRERKEDLPLLCSHLVQKLNKILGKHVQGVTPATQELLQRHHWPGNVRELENVLERAMNLNTGDWIVPDALPAFLVNAETVTPPYRSTSPNIPTPSANTTHKKKDVMAAAERDLIMATLQECGGNRSLAASRLAISRSTLYQKIKKYEIEETSFFASKSQRP